MFHWLRSAVGGSIWWNSLVLSWSRDRKKRARAIDRLRNTRRPRAIRVLEEALFCGWDGEENPSRAFDALLEAVLAPGRPVNDKLLNGAAYALSRCHTKFESRTLAALGKAFSDGDPAVRLRAITVLKDFGSRGGDPAELDLLWGAACDCDAQVAFSAIYTLSDRLLDPPHIDVYYARDALQDALKVRQRTAHQALSPAQARLVDALVGLLSHEELRVRRFAAFRLAYLGDLRALDPLLGILPNESWLSLSDVTALARLNDLRAVTAVSYSLHDKWNSEVRRFAAQFLGEVGDERSIDVLLAVPGDSRDDAQSAIRKIGSRLLGEARLKVLRHVLDHTPPNWSCFLDWAEELVTNGDSRGAQELLRGAHVPREGRRPVAALDRILRTNASRLSQEHLRAIASLAGVTDTETVDYEMRECVSGATLVEVPVDCTEVQRFAEEELGRRGLEP